MYVDELDTVPRSSTGNGRNRRCRLRRYCDLDRPKRRQRRWRQSQHYCGSLGRRSRDGRGVIIALSIRFSVHRIIIFQQQRFSFPFPTSRLPGSVSDVGIQYGSLSLLEFVLLSVHLHNHHCFGSSGPTGRSRKERRAIDPSRPATFAARMLLSYTSPLTIQPRRQTKGHPYFQQFDSILGQLMQMSVGRKRPRAPWTTHSNSTTWPWPRLNDR